MRHSWMVRARVDSRAVAVGVAAVLLAGALRAAAGSIAEVSAGVLSALAALVAAPVLDAARRGPDDAVHVAAGIRQKEPGDRVWPNVTLVRSLLRADAAVAAEDHGCGAGL